MVQVHSSQLGRTSPARRKRELLFFRGCGRVSGERGATRGALRAALVPLTLRSRAVVSAAVEISLRPASQWFTVGAPCVVSHCKSRKDFHGRGDAFELKRANTTQDASTMKRA